MDEKSNENCKTLVKCKFSVNNSCKAKKAVLKFVTIQFASKYNFLRSEGARLIQYSLFFCPISEMR